MAPLSKQHLHFFFNPHWTPVTSEAWKTSSSSSADSKGWGEPSASQNYGLELPSTRLVTMTWRWKALYSITSTLSNLLNPAPLCLIETLFSLCYPGHSGQCNSVNLSADFHLCRITFLAIKSTGTNLRCSFLAIQYWSGNLWTQCVFLQADPGHTLINWVLWKGWCKKAKQTISFGVCLDLQQLPKDKESCTWIEKKHHSSKSSESKEHCQGCSGNWLVFSKSSAPFVEFECSSSVNTLQDIQVLALSLAESEGFGAAEILWGLWQVLRCWLYLFYPISWTQVQELFGLPQFC